MGIKMAMRNGEVGIDAYGTRKSFYGKCGVREVGGVRFLRSYDTEYYAAAYNGVIVALSTRWSATSGQHLDAFAAYCGIGWQGKKSWENAPYTEEARYLSDIQHIAEAVRECVTNIKTNPKAWSA